MTPFSNALAKRRENMSRTRNWVKQVYEKAANLVSTKKQDFTVIEGHPPAQEHTEGAVDTVPSVKNNLQKLKKEFKIYRWNPNQPNTKPFLQSFFVDLSTCGPMVWFIWDIIVIWFEIFILFILVGFFFFFDFEGFRCITKDKSRGWLKLELQEIL